MAGLELGQVEDVVEQLHQHAARVVGDLQLATLLVAQWAVQGQVEHPQQAVERCADLVAHVGEEGGARLGHLQRRAACRFQLLVVAAEAAVGGLQFGRACRDNVLQFGEVLGQALVGLPALLHLGGEAGQLAVGHFHQHADLVLFVAGRAGQLGVRRGARVALAEGTDQPHQGLGQHAVEEHQEDQRQQQAAHESAEEGKHGAAQEVVAEGEGVHLQAQHAEGLVGRMDDVERVLELAALVEQVVAEDAEVALGARTADAGQYRTVVVDDLGAYHRRRAQEAEHQLLGELGIDVVGDSGSGAVGDFEEGLDLPIDRGVLVEVVAGHLDDAQDCPEDERHQNRQAGLFERQPLSQRNIHWTWDGPCSEGLPSIAYPVCQQCLVTAAEPRS
ncbi:hypothetical protein D3C85_726220 [compost metagenome]